MKMKKVKLILFWTILLLSSYSMSNAQGTYKVIVATNFEGEVSEGSIEKLIELIREGKPVRVGYQLDFNKDKISDFDHWLEAEFITILNGHVFTQIDPIYMQGPNIDVPQVEIFPSNTKWTAVLGTNGKLLNRYVFDKLEFKLDKDGNPIMDEATEKELKKREVRTWEVATFWSVQM